MPAGMQYNPIQVGNPAFFKSYLVRHLQWELETDHRCLNNGTIYKFGRVGFLIFALVFVSHDFEETSFVKSPPSVPYGANLFILHSQACVICILLNVV